MVLSLCIQDGRYEGLNRDFLPILRLLDSKGKPAAHALVLEIPTSGYRREIHSPIDGIVGVSFDAGTRIFASNGKYVGKKVVKDWRIFSMNPVDLKLSKVGAVLQGQIQDEEGKPIPFAKVKCTRWTGDSGAFMSETNSDAKGMFKIEGLWQDFQYSVDVSADGYGLAPTLVRHSVIEGKTHQVDPISIPRADSFIEGEVINEEGRLVPNSVVALVEYPGKSVQSDENGRFRIDGVSKDSHLVQASGANTYGYRTIAGGQWKRIIVKPYTRIQKSGNSLSTEK